MASKLTTPKGPGVDKPLRGDVNQDSSLYLEYEQGELETAAETSVLDDIDCSWLQLQGTMQYPTQ